ncbi:hypothetical protein BGZ98_000156 [Dissophora globulifera]|nr:hypothetical protein BGZ98_000156 [Dissophora globulifera]
MSRPAPKMQAPMTASASLTGNATPQLTFPPPPTILGSQPLYYLARRFPILAEQELKALPVKTALDYSSFLIGAMTTSYPSVITLRAVVRQFRNFLKESGRQLVQRQQQGVSGPSPALLELPRARIWSRTIRALIWLKQYRRARVAIHAMQRLGIKPTGFAWRMICRSWLEQGQLDRAEALAVKVFTQPNISHDYGLEERPYYFTDIQETQLSSPNSGPAARQLRRSPMSPNTLPLSLVIQALAECGQMERARHWFDQIPPNEVTDLLTSDMVAGYLKVGQQSKAQEMIRIMARCGIKPTAIVYNPIIEHATEAVGMELAESLVKDMIELGIFLNLFTYKILIRGYISRGERGKAYECIRRMQASGVEPDRALGRTLLDGIWNLGQLRKGDLGPLGVYSLSRSPEEQSILELEDLNFVVEPGWSHRCIKWTQQRKFELVEEALQQSMDTGAFKPDIEALQVVKALVGEQEMTRARRWFDRIINVEGSLQDPAMVVRTVDDMVSGYIQQHQPELAEDILSAMAERGLAPTVNAINTILQWSTLHESMEDAEGLVRRMAQSGIEPNQQTFDILCEGYAARGALDSLKECLERMEGAGFIHSDSNSSAEELRRSLFGQPNNQYPPVGDHSTPNTNTPSTSSSILETLCARWVDQGRMEQADEFAVCLISNSNVPADKIPYGILIQGWINQSQRSFVSSSAAQAMAQLTSNTKAAKPGSSSDGASWTSQAVPSSASLNAEIRVRAESVDKINKARQWFDRTPEQQRTTELVNKMIGGYMTFGLEQEAEELIHWMAAHRVKPDVTTYNHMLMHTIQQLPMLTAEGMVNKMRKGGLTPNIDTWNLLIRGYVIRGELVRALKCLDRMTAPSTPPAHSVSVPRSGSRTRKIMETYDREILDAVVHYNNSDGRNDTEETADYVEKERTDGEALQRDQFAATGPCWVVEPNETTVQLILSGFGPELKPTQGEGDHERALELYRDRVARQQQQKERLFQGLESLSALEGSKRAKRRGDSEERQEIEEEEQILRHLTRLSDLGLLSSDVAMTGQDWKNELKWEETMETERERERALTGRS